MFVFVTDGQKNKCFYPVGVAEYSVSASELSEFKSLLGYQSSMPLAASAADKIGH